MNDTTLTPLYIIEKLGGFDFDPCGYPGHYTAKKVSCFPIDGLSIQWEGKVWLNPPYSNPFPFLKKLCEHGEGIALVLASTDTIWFHDIINKASGILFMKGRPKFLRADYSPVQLMRATMLISFGVECKECLKNSGIDGMFISLENYIKYTKPKRQGTTKKKSENSLPKGS